MRRKSSQRNAIWPYLGVLACLFVLSVTAPRAWERIARKAPLDTEPARPRVASQARPAKSSSTSSSNDTTPRKSTRRSAASRLSAARNC